ncbi:RNA polymerase sigma factor [Amycolatopsis methanolica]|uniref:ECF subfamily RNA polymerase sigma-70 factor n=1 Tax=Amycolatopsis methanolica 239 TaxID=1068978 RepID=A0A076MIV7_AMYME|nr:sigma-70 family RNA polymerase sigma factor [Amycolatopsis methanolica]AIJ20679.1 ECF subfamily RNA polymerase sigma-70 factor [Amycolatopsis methanolica 239]
MTDDPLRELAPQVLAILMRRYGGLDTCEDAVQEALLAAATQWGETGVPDNPRGWLLTVATRRLTDWMRSDSARRRREDEDLLATPATQRVAPGADERGPGDADDTLTLLFLCCHPSLSVPSQTALTLRAVGGLTTAEIAKAFFVPEATMAQRISRAKQKVKGARFSLPPEEERDERLNAVLHVLYLMFNEGYTATAGPDLRRDDLAAEAIRLTRLVRRLLPSDWEVAGLLALMLLTHARRFARTVDGELVPLSEQDRSRWDRAMIEEGVALVSEALAKTTRLGAYQLQAAIAAVHDEAASDDETDWPQVLALYGLLERVAPNPMVTLNKAVAVAMTSGPRAGLELLESLAGDPRLAKHHRLHAVRAHLLERAGETAEARKEYQLAAKRTTSLPEQRYLQRRAARCTTPS